MTRRAEQPTGVTLAPVTASRAKPFAVALAALAACALTPASALASSNAGATSAYLRANYQFVHSATSRTAQIEKTLHTLPGRIAGECGSAAKGSPQDPDSEQLSNELIGDMVLSAGLLDLPAARTYVSAVNRLHWSNASLTRAIHSYASEVTTLAGLSAPHVCADVRSWAASGYKQLAPGTVSFDSVFMNVWVSPGYLPSALKHYETSGERSLIHATVEDEYAIAELETREETTWWNAMDTLDLWP